MDWRNRLRMGVGLRQTGTEHPWPSASHSIASFLDTTTSSLKQVETCPSGYSDHSLSPSYVCACRQPGSLHNSSLLQYPTLYSPSSLPLPYPEAIYPTRITGLLSSLRGLTPSHVPLTCMSPLLHLQPHWIQNAETPTSLQADAGSCSPISSFLCWTTWHLSSAVNYQYQDYCCCSEIHLHDYLHTIRLPSFLTVRLSPRWHARVRPQQYGLNTQNCLHEATRAFTS